MYSEYDWTAGDDWNFLDSVIYGGAEDSSNSALDYSYQDWMGDGGGDTSSDVGSNWWSSLFGGGDGDSGDDSGNFWGSVLSAAGTYAMNEANKKDAKELSKEEFERRMELMKAGLAEKEKYYQLHGKQLADAYGNYAQYNTAPVNPFGLLAQGGGFGTSGGFGNG